MDVRQCEAIKQTMADLCDVIDPQLFLPFLRMRNLMLKSECDLVSLEKTSEAKILRTFDLVIPKCDTWDVTIEYLNLHSYRTVANTLLEAAGLEPQTVQFVSDTDNVAKHMKLSDFTNRVTNHYLGDYRVVESFDTNADSEPIEKVWVDLLLEGSRETIADYKQMFTQMKEKRCRLALVKGQPGSGKTTLVKKIAYDWAKESRKIGYRLAKTFGRSHNFDIILAVPLRKVPAKRFSDVLQMAVGSFVDFRHDIANQICVDIRRHRLKVLVILDGLDELNSACQTSLGQIFGRSNRDAMANAQVSVQFDFDLLVTSRPYACQHLNPDIMTARYEVVGFTEVKRVEFIQQRCKRPEGMARAIEYFSQSDVLGEISQNPLLLNWICFLSDLNESIPTTLTYLYATFVHRMLQRSQHRKSLANYSETNWQQSEMVKRLGSLALLGVIKNQFEFSQEEMQICGVETDSFTSGLLLYRSDPVSLALKSDFHHRSVQDFMAALYSVHFWKDKCLAEATNWVEVSWHLQIIPRLTVEMMLEKMSDRFGDSQYCRFYFGLISGTAAYEPQMRLAIDGMFKVEILSHPRLLWLHQRLADCTDAENRSAGKMFNEAINRIIDIHRTGWTDVQTDQLMFRSWKFEQSGQLLFFPNNRNDFYEGLQLRWIGDSFRSFCITSIENSQVAKVLYICLDDQDLLENLTGLRDIVSTEWLFLFERVVDEFFDDKKDLVQTVLSMFPSTRFWSFLDSKKSDPINIRVWLKRTGTNTVDPKGETKVEFIRLSVGSLFGEKVISNICRYFTVSSIEKLKDRKVPRTIVHVTVCEALTNIEILQMLISDSDLVILN